MGRISVLTVDSPQMSSARVLPMWPHVLPMSILGCLIPLFLTWHPHLQPNQRWRLVIGRSQLNLSQEFLPLRTTVTRLKEILTKTTLSNIHSKIILTKKGSSIEYVCVTRAPINGIIDGKPNGILPAAPHGLADDKPLYPLEQLC